MGVLKYENEYIGERVIIHEAIAAAFSVVNNGSHLDVILRIYGPE